MVEPEQKKRNVFLDDFPGGLLIIGAVLIVFFLNLLSGAKVIGVDQEKVAIKKEWILLNNEKEDFYRKKKEWDGIEQRLMAGRAELEALKNQSKEEADKLDGLQKENTTLDETGQGLKKDVAVLEARKDEAGKQESELESMVDESQRKLGGVKTENGDLVQTNQDLDEKNKKLEERNAFLEKEISANEDALKNAIKDFVSYVENLKIQSDKIAAITEGLDSKKQGFDQVASTIQDNSNKLLTLSQSLQAELDGFIDRTDDLKASNSSEDKVIVDLNNGIKFLNSVKGDFRSIESRDKDNYQTILDKLETLENEIKLIKLSAKQNINSK